MWQNVFCVIPIRMLYFQLIHESSQSYTLCKGYDCLGKLRCLSLKDG